MKEYDALVAETKEKQSKVRAIGQKVLNHHWDQLKKREEEHTKLVECLRKQKQIIEMKRQEIISRIGEEETRLKDEVARH